MRKIVPKDKQISIPWKVALVPFVADPQDYDADLDPSFHFDEEQDPESETLRCGSKIPLLTFMRSGYDFSF